MRQRAKQWLGLVAVALLSSGVTLGTYVYLTKDQRGLTSDGYSLPVSFTSMSAAPAVSTDFTVAAESSVHAVVHIKAISMKKGYAQSSDPFFDF